MKSYIDELNRPFLVLAPMYDVTDTVFRRVVASCAPADLYMTEFVNVDGLQSPGHDKLAKRLRFEPSEQPLIAQIWGQKPENYYKTARELVEMGFAGIDINMGCPDKSVVRNGCGGGMINHPEQAHEVIQATREGAAGSIPVSVKTRIGFREFDPSWLEGLLALQLPMLSLHLRTVREMSKVPAHWELMTDVRMMRDKLAPDTLLVGNGDVMNRAEAIHLAAEHGIDGVMIGRGIFQDPYAFSEDTPWENMYSDKKIALFKQHVALFAETWQEGERPIVTLNKFCKVYVNGFEGAKELREDLMSATSIDDLMNRIEKISNSWSLEPVS